MGADKAYDTREFVAEYRDGQITPHVTKNTSGRQSAIDGRTTPHPGYAISQRVRRQIEEIFGCVKTVGGGRKLRYIGRERNQFWAELTTATYSLRCMARIEAARRALAASVAT